MIINCHNKCNGFFQKLKVSKDLVCKSRVDIPDSYKFLFLRTQAARNSKYSRGFIFIHPEFSEFCRGLIFVNRKKKHPGSHVNRENANSNLWFEN